MRNYLFHWIFYLDSCYIMKSSIYLELDFLISEGYIIKTDNSVRFFHQIILDNALVDKMVNDYNEGKSIFSIIGNFSDKKVRYKHSRLYLTFYYLPCLGL